MTATNMFSNFGGFRCSPHISLTVNPKTVAVLLAISYLVPPSKDVVWQVIKFL